MSRYVEASDGARGGVGHYAYHAFTVISLDPMHRFEPVQFPGSSFLYLMPGLRTAGSSVGNRLLVAVKLPLESRQECTREINWIPGNLVRKL